MKKQIKKRGAAFVAKPGEGIKVVADGTDPAASKTLKKNGAEFVIGTAGKPRVIGRRPQYIVGKNGAAILMHHTAKPPRIKGKAAQGKYVGMTDAEIARQAEELLHATTKIVTGALKSAAVEIGKMLAQVTRNDGTDVRAAARVGAADYMARELLAKWQNELELLA